MRLDVIARVWLQNLLWRATGLRPAGRAVVRALESPDPNVRTIAGMLLVRAGLSAEPLLLEAVAARRSLPLVAQILADIGDRRLEPTLSTLSRDHDPEVARAAREALRVLAAQPRPPSSGGSGRRVPPAGLAAVAFHFEPRPCRGLRDRVEGCRATNVVRPRIRPGIDTVERPDVL
jgi:hypothetical protein